MGGTRGADCEQCDGVEGPHRPAVMLHPDWPVGNDLVEGRRIEVVGAADGSDPFGAGRCAGESVEAVRKEGPTD